MIANVSRVVSRVVDRIAGDRSDVPLMVAAACVEALKQHSIESRVMYGQMAWVEVLEDNSVTWAGCWGQHSYFWVATQYGEVVDLNASVAHRKRAHDLGGVRSLYSPPMLWSAEVPAFFRIAPEGVAELELHDDRDKRQFELVLKEVRAKCGPEHLAVDEDQLSTQFANEPIICPGRRILDDSEQTFRKFDRVLAVKGIPQPAPF